MAVTYLKHGKAAADRAEDDAKTAAIVAGTLKSIEDRGDAAVRVIGGALAVELPRDRVGGFPVAAMLPPGVPELAEVVAGVGWGFFVKLGGEESGGSEE